MRYLTWDGMRLFQKPETAATFALDENKDSKKVKILQNGRLESPERWEIEELEAHMRDQVVF